MNNIDRRNAQMAYIADESVIAEMAGTRKLLRRFNTMDPDDGSAMTEILRELLGTCGEGAWITPPFQCDYGKHIHVGKNFYANYNCAIVDVAPVTIGDNCLLAPGVQIYTAGHPIHPDASNSHYEYGIEVTIGDNCWLGGCCIIVPGVHIGNNVVVAAGAVVTKDVPDNSVVAGNPARVIKTITAEDRKYYFKKREFDPEAKALIDQEFPKNALE